MTIKRLIIFLLLPFASGKNIAQQNSALHMNKKPGATPLNVIFILTDDHRYDFMGFTGKVPWLKTPNLDKLAKEGVWIRNASVTTSLCSPSRASILTGMYAHKHTVVDNSSPLPPNLIFFPQYLQQAGYATAFFGKWHIGEADDGPQKGFDQWESFRGQGVYYNPTLNINGKETRYGDSTYITELLTQHTIDWLGKQDKNKPFFVYLSHKAVHAEFYPSKKFKDVYKNESIPYPSTINITASDTSIVYGSTQECPTGEMVKNDTSYNVADIPKWVCRQRYSWHGVDYMYHGQIAFDDFYRRYCETLLSVDESVGEIIQYLKESGRDKNTVIIYMGDNGFLMGEHGLIDKRNMYEESMKVPLLVYAPGLIEGGQTLDEIIQNIDMAPTILDIAGIQKPDQMQGVSFYPLLKGQQLVWRDRAFYEYYWEYAFPQTPTTFGVREGNYKFIFYPGIWDINEFYDLKNDPEEKKNLIRATAYQPLISKMRDELYDWLEETGGMQIPLKRLQGKRMDNLYKDTY
ncbi:MAG TPA: sulfatase [Parafilimonas sp.]|nr:sulfatase [Parafilimonas sp.]